MSVYMVGIWGGRGVFLEKDTSGSELFFVGNLYLLKIRMRGKGHAEFVFQNSCLMEPEM